MKLLSRIAILGLSMTAAVAAQADIKDRLYDFTDSFYLRNGINPAMIAGRPQADGTRFVTSAPVKPGQRNVRALFTIGAWDDNTKPIFFTILGGVSGLAFTNDSAGVYARSVADRAPEYIFPKLGTNPTGLGDVRQNFILDRRHGYFSNNPLGLWIHVWVNYTPAAFNTERGRKELEDLREDNGTALDGTPIIAKTSEIEDLADQGLVTLTTLPEDNNLRYALCPIVKDPTDGGIAPDQFLFTVRNASGRATDRRIERSFLSLQSTGDWP